MRGRMDLTVSDLGRSKSFYDLVLGFLGYRWRRPSGAHAVGDGARLFEQRDVGREDLHASLDDDVALLVHQLVVPPGVGVQLEHDALGDALRLRQVLGNLLSNAVKFNEAGGQVIVSTALTDAGHAVIRVKDTGLGMTEQELATALEPFRQLPTSRKTGGTGLGLPLTKALVEANRAAFVIKSARNSGTLVEITFPPTRVLAN